MTTYLTYYPMISDPVNCACVIKNAIVPKRSSYATSLHDYLNLVNCGYMVTISAKTFNDELKTVLANLVDALYNCKITLDEYSSFNFILHKTRLANLQQSTNL